MNTVITILLFTLLSVSAQTVDHKRVVYQCMHDDMDATDIVPKDFLDTFEDNYINRNLQSVTPQPIRITIDYKELDNISNGEGLTESKKQYLKKIILAAQVYLSKIIKVYPRTKPIKMTKNICYDMKVTQQIQDYGIENSDLHIYVTYFNNSTVSTLASAIYCQMDPNPIVGRVKFNIGTMNFNEEFPLSFQDNFTISLHEILHILGFSGSMIQYWIDPQTGKPYGDENSHKVIKKENRWEQKNVNKILSNNILRVARNHYQCPSIDGMYLENQGGGGSKGSHWERDLLGNEFMTASLIQGNFVFTEFTAALLLDTGYYAQINSNLLAPIYWGKNKGCDFFNKICDDGRYFPEFPDESVEESCDFYSLGVGILGNYDYFSQCKKVKIYFDSLCTDIDNFKPDPRQRHNTGAGSRCFRSNASAIGEQENSMSGRCFKAKCNNDGQSIQVNVWDNEFVTCQYPNQVIDLARQTRTSQGIMKCPDDFDMFCNLPHNCPNNCSSNGICVNGQCICLNQWAGEDCSKPCPDSYALDGNTCIPRCHSGQFKNFDNTCKQTCPLKQYKESATRTCELCSTNCSSCTGPSDNQCLTCNNSYTLLGNKCVDTSCDESCLSCSGQGSNSCTSCSLEKYLDANNSCQLCKTPCRNCSSETVCLSCDSEFIMDVSSGKCVSKNTCDISCKTCSAFQDPSKCTSCSDGQYLDRYGSCLSCDESCAKCINHREQCTECSRDYEFNYYSKCVDINTIKKQVKENKCDYTCSQCVSPLYDSCTSCTGNRVLYKKRSNLKYGYCVCPYGTTDVNKPICLVESQLQDNIKSSTQSAFVASTTTSTIVSAATSNPVVALGMMEFSQSVSYLSYVNKRPAVGFDDTMNVVSFSHTSNFINVDSIAEYDAKEEKNNMNKDRHLQEETSVNIEEEDEDEYRNPKLSYNHKTQLFFINALVLIIINSAVWALSGILGLIKADQDKKTIFFRLRRIYNFSIPIVVFTLSSQEFSLLIFLQMLNLKMNTRLQILSSVFSFITLTYIIGFIFFLFYWIEFKKVLVKTSSAESKDNSSVWQQRLYLIHKHIKQDSFFTRNFVQITILRKVIISFIAACISNSPNAQVSLLLICYTSYLVYLTVCKPFKSTLYTVMMIILDAIIIIIHVLYCIMCSYDGDSDTEKIISLMMLLLTFSVFASYLIYTLIIIAKICYNLYKKYQAKKAHLKSYVTRPQI